jgi:hypothetical protein
MLAPLPGSPRQSHPQEIPGKSRYPVSMARPRKKGKLITHTYVRGKKKGRRVRALGYPDGNFAAIRTRSGGFAMVSGSRSRRRRKR